MKASTPAFRNEQSINSQILNSARSRINFTFEPKIQSEVSTFSKVKNENESAERLHTFQGECSGSVRNRMSLAKIEFDNSSDRSIGQSTVTDNIVCRRKSDYHDSKMNESESGSGSEAAVATSQSNGLKKRRTNPKYRIQWSAEEVSF